jgi:nucleotide-binding universal stress UspA family protein
MPGWEWIVVVGGFLAALAALNATIFSSSHVSFALGRGGSLHPTLARIHPRHRTPYVAVIVSTVAIVLMAALLPLKDVASVADLLFILLFMQLHFAVIALRKREPETERPFKVPLYPLPQIIALVAYFVLVWQFIRISPVGLAITIIWVLIGLLIYYAYSVPHKVEEIEKHTLFEEKMKFDEKAHYRILLPLMPEPGWKGMLRIALSMAKSKNGEIHVLRITEIPPASPLEVAGTIADGEREFLERAAQICEAEKVNISTMHMVSRDVSQTVLDVARKMDADLLILGWHGYSRARRRIFGWNLERMLRQVRCDLAVVKLSGYEEMGRILVAVASGTRTELAAEVAASLAQNSGGRITALHFAARDLPEQKVQAELGQLLHSFPGNLAVDGRVVRNIPLAETVLKAERSYDVIIMASPRESLFRGMLLGDAAEEVAQRTARTLIIVKHYGEIVRPIIEHIKDRFSRSAKPAA